MVDPADGVSDADTSPGSKVTLENGTIFWVGYPFSIDTMYNVIGRYSISVGMVGFFLKNTSIEDKNAPPGESTKNDCAIGSNQTVAVVDVDVEVGVSRGRV